MGAAWRARALWSARLRGASRFQHDSFDLGHFDQVFLPKLQTAVHRGVNSKVVDLTTLYNFYKGSIVFLPMDCAQFAAKL
jgi:hypothetical protein